MFFSKSNNALLSKAHRAFFPPGQRASRPTTGFATDSMYFVPLDSFLIPVIVVILDIFVLLEFLFKFIIVFFILFVIISLVFARNIVLV